VTEDGNGNGNGETRVDEFKTLAGEQEVENVVSFFQNEWTVE